MCRILLATILLAISTPLFGQSSVEFTIDHASKRDYKIEVLRFYISAISLSYTDGSQFIDTTTAYLIDLDDPASFTISLDQSSTAKIVESITFTLGTDSLLNVAGIVEGALDPIHGMYWAWNSGYINFKVEGHATKEVKTKFAYHLGGYLSPFSTSRIITLPVRNSKGKIVINLDLYGFLLGIDKSNQSEIMIPGEAATLLSDQLSRRFTIHE